MNYIRELNAFYDWLETNPLNHQCIALWHALMHTNSKAGWKKEFTVAVITLELKTGLNRRAIERARNTLEQVGLIRWRKRSGNQSAIYEMIPLSEKIVRQNDIQTVVQSDAQSVAINKTKLNETKNKNNNPPISPQKRHYAEYVTMTEGEYQKLVEAHGEEFARRCIEVLNNYKGANGKKYKSDYLAILNWVVGRVKEEMAREKSRRSVARRGNEIDYDFLSL